MIKLRLSLEYHCYPLWIYSEDGEFIDNNFPKELECNRNIDVLLDDIQKIFDNLFIDDGVEFSYKGFDDENSKYDFYMKVKYVERLILDILGINGVLENKILLGKL